MILTHEQVIGYQIWIILVTPFHFTIQFTTIRGTVTGRRRRCALEVRLFCAVHEPPPMIKNPEERCFLWQFHHIAFLVFVLTTDHGGYVETMTVPVHRTRTQSAKLPTNDTSIVRETQFSTNPRARDSERPSGLLALACTDHVLLETRSRNRALLLLGLLRRVQHERSSVDELRTTCSFLVRNTSLSIAFLCNLSRTRSFGFRPSQTTHLPSP